MLETERLLLDIPSEAHLAAIFKVHADPSTQQFNPDGPATHIEQFRKTYKTWIAHHDTHQFGYYILVEKLTGEPFGVCGLQYACVQGEIVLNVYYRIATDNTRKGFVKEALTAIIDHVCQLTEDQYRMLVLTKKENIPSIKTAESLGFQYDKTLDNLNGEGNVFFFNR